MQSFTLKFITGILLAISSSVLYAEVNCPTTSQVKDISFLRADGAADIWDLFSAPFQYGHRDWELLFTVYLPSAENTQDALTKGTDYYRYQVAFFEQPIGIESQDKQTCYYAQQESSYFVRAISRN